MLFGHLTVMAAISDGRYGRRNGQRSEHCWQCEVAADALVAHAQSVSENALCCAALRCCLSDSALNCCLKACSKKEVPSVLTQQPSGKQRVSGTVSSVWTMADKALLPSDELLMDYGKGFW